MSVRLILVRHGLSSFNEKGLIQGRTDDSFLTDRGYEEASKAGKALSGINFDKIYSSPLVRAAETAKTICKNLKGGNNIIYDKNLLEVDLSEWSGLTINEINRFWNGTNNNDGVLRWDFSSLFLNIKNGIKLSFKR